MITYADVEKLHVTHSEDPPVLSLYLEVPLDLPALRGLSARAGELLNSAAGGPCGPDGPDAERALTGARQAVRRILEDNARDWLGHCVAIFICGPADLAEAIPLPAGLGEQAVFGPRPHVRPLLVALQRHPAYHVVVVNRLPPGSRSAAATEPSHHGLAPGHQLQRRPCPTLIARSPARPSVGSAGGPTARSASPPVTARRPQHLPAVRGAVESGRGW